jgi:hypothetical protein
MDTFSRKMVVQDVAAYEITLVSGVAGCPQNFLANECVPYAQPGAVVQYCAADGAAPATLVPKDSVVLTFVVDKDGNTFVWKDGLFAARPDYCMKSVVGCDSIVYGFAYHDKQLAVPVVRLFDACRLKGRCLRSMNCFERFGQLFADMSVSSKTSTSVVRMHWVWTETWLHDFVLCKADEQLHGLDCQWQSAIRLPLMLTQDAYYHTITRNSA